MLDRQNLATITQRTLRQQPDLGKAVQYHPVRLRAIDGGENLLGGFAQFEIGGIEQALLLLGIEQALRRQQLIHFDARVELPAMGSRTEPQLALGFGQRDVEAFLAGARPLHQKLERNRGLPGPGRPLDQKHVLPGEPASPDIIQAPDAALCLTHNRLDQNVASQTEVNSQRVQAVPCQTELILGRMAGVLKEAGPAATGWWGSEAARPSIGLIGPAGTPSRQQTPPAVRLGLKTLRAWRGLYPRLRAARKEMSDRNQP